MSCCYPGDRVRGAERHLAETRRKHEVSHLQVGAGDGPATGEQPRPRKALGKGTIFLVHALPQWATIINFLSGILE